MADVTVAIELNKVSYTTWLRTTLVGMANVANSVPLIESTEFGQDQEDAFINFVDEACREVLKVFSNRQGDVTGTPFEKTATTVTYRINEATPVLPQASSLKETLNEDVKNAIYTFITSMWFKLKKNTEMVEYLMGRYEKLTSNIDHCLYKLHD